MATIFSIAALLSLLSAGAMTLSLWTLARTRLPGCGGGSGCEAVLSSRWSRWWRFPVAGIASWLYLFILICSLSLHIFAGVWQQAAWMVLLPCGFTAAAAALWFLGLQAFVVRRFCFYCVAINVMGLCIGAIVIRSMPFYSPRDHALVGALGCLAGALTLLLIIGQVFLRPTLYSVEQADNGAGSSNPTDEAVAMDVGDRGRVVFPDETAAINTRFVSREVRLLAGRVSLEIGAWPMLGPPDARFAIACCFDYTCSGCRHVRQLLVDAVRFYHPQLCALILPAPQHPDCNPHMSAPVIGREDACRYARLALALWRTGAASYAAFEVLLYECETLPPFDQVLERTSAWLNGALTDLSDPWLDDMIGRAVAAHRASGITTIPTILLPRARISGQVPSMKELHVILQKELGLTELAAQGQAGS